MLEELEQVRKVAHDSMWYASSENERRDAYAKLLKVINDLKGNFEKKNETQASEKPEKQTKRKVTKK